MATIGAIAGMDGMILMPIVATVDGGNGFGLVVCSALFVIGMACFTLETRREWPKV